MRAATDFAREEAERRADAVSMELDAAKDALADAELRTNEAEAAVEALTMEMEMAAEEAELSRWGCTR